MEALRILICGSGPGAIQYGVLLTKCYPSAEISYYARNSRRNREYQKLASDNQLTFTVSAEKASVEKFCGQVTPCKFVIDLNQLTGQFDLLVLAGPVFTYHAVLQEILSLKLISDNGDLLTASSYLGTGAVLSNLLESYSDKIGLAVFGDYLAVSTRDPSSPLNFFARSYKAYIRLYLADQISPRLQPFFKEFIVNYLQEISYSKNYWEVSQGNTNLFHLPLVIHDSLKDRYFNPAAEEFYFYAPYPAGAISYEVELNCVKFEDELISVFELLGLERMNFLKFRLERGDLPRPFVDPEVIEKYPTLSQPERACLTIMYSWIFERRSLGIEKLSGPQVDKSSLIKFPRVKVSEGKGHLPRIPLEDYACLKGLIQFAAKVDHRLPVSEALCELFEKSCQQLPAFYGYELDFEKADFDAVAACYTEIFLKRSTSNGL